MRCEMLLFSFRNRKCIAMQFKKLFCCLAPFWYFLKKRDETRGQRVKKYALLFIAFDATAVVTADSSSWQGGERAIAEAKRMSPGVDAVHAQLGPLKEESLRIRRELDVLEKLLQQEEWQQSRIHDVLEHHAELERAVDIFPLIYSDILHAAEHDAYADKQLAEIVAEYAKHYRDVPLFLRNPAVELLKEVQQLLCDVRSVLTVQDPILADVVVQSLERYKQISMPSRPGLEKYVRSMVRKLLPLVRKIQVRPTTRLALPREEPVRSLEQTPAQVAREMQKLKKAYDHLHEYRDVLTGKLRAVSEILRDSVLQAKDLALLSQRYFELEQYALGGKSALERNLENVWIPVLGDEELKAASEIVREDIRKIYGQFAPQLEQFRAQGLSALQPVMEAFAAGEQLIRDCADRQQSFLLLLRQRLGYDSACVPPPTLYEKLAKLLLWGASQGGTVQDVVRKQAHELMQKLQRIAPSAEVARVLHLVEEFYACEQMMTYQDIDAEDVRQRLSHVQKESESLPQFLTAFQVELQRRVQQLLERVEG